MNRERITDIRMTQAACLELPRRNSSDSNLYLCLYNTRLGWLTGKRNILLISLHYGKFLIYYFDSRTP
jgi:hypothetical protein